MAAFHFWRSQWGTREPALRAGEGTVTGVAFACDGANRAQPPRLGRDPPPARRRHGRAAGDPPGDPRAPPGRERQARAAPAMRNGRVDRRAGGARRARDRCRHLPRGARRRARARAQRGVRRGRCARVTDPARAQPLRPRLHGRFWGLGQIVTAVAHAGLTIHSLEEFSTIYETYWREKDPRVPGQFLLLADKPAQAP